MFARIQCHTDYESGNDYFANNYKIYSIHYYDFLFLTNNIPININIMVNPMFNITKNLPILSTGKSKDPHANPNVTCANAISTCDQYVTSSLVDLFFTEDTIASIDCPVKPNTNTLIIFNFQSSIFNQTCRQAGIWDEKLYSQSSHPTLRLTNPTIFNINLYFKNFNHHHE